MKKNLLDRIAQLESLNDQLNAEIRYLDELLKKVGFNEGLISLKKAAIELLEEEKNA